MIKLKFCGVAEVCALRITMFNGQLLSTCKSIHETQSPSKMDSLSSDCGLPPFFFPRGVCGGGGGGGGGGMKGESYKPNPSRGYHTTNLATDEISSR